MKTIKEVDDFISETKAYSYWFIDLLDQLDYSEIASLLKTNRFTWSDRKYVKNIYMPFRIMRDNIPAIAIAITGRIILDCLEGNFKGDKD